MLHPSFVETAGVDGSTGPAGVVFVHGMRTSGAIWDHQLDVVRAAGHPALAVDLPGHGVRRAGRFTMQAAFDVIEEAAAAVTRGRADAPWVLVGLSLGGYTSLAYAARRAAPAPAPAPAPGVAATTSARAARTARATARPGVLAGVVAASCTTDTHGLPLHVFRTGLRGALAAGRVTRELRGRFASAAGSVVVPRPLRAALRRGEVAHDATRPVLPLPTPPGWDLVADALRDLAGESSVRNLRACDVPVWLVNGSRDQLRMQERRHARAVPGTRLVVVPGAGHDVSLEAPDAFSAALLDAMTAFAR